MFVNFNILNQLGSPAINSNTFANRPAAGQTGRLFVSTDTFEIYRDNGTTWDLIGGPGSSTITGTGTATQVAYFTSSQAIGSSANLYWDNTAGALGINTATPGAELDVHGTGTIAQFNTTAATGNVFLAIQRSGTGLWRIGDTYNSGSNYFELHNTTLASNAIQIAAATNKSILTSLETYSTGVARGNYLDYTLSLANGTTFTSPNTVTALGATLNLNIAGSATIPAGARSGADFFNGINFTSAGTFTVNQASTIRAFSNVTAGWAFNGSAVGTVTHLAGLRVLFPTNSGSAINVTDNYALLINNQNANTGTITYTNRWGIYQEGASDLNYMAANLLLGSTVNTGDKLQVTGTTYLSSQLTVGNTLYVDTVFNHVGIGTTSPDAQLVTNGSTSSRINMRGGDVRYGTLYADAGLFAVSSITSIPLILATNDLERMRITAGGIVGVGTGASAIVNDNLLPIQINAVATTGQAYFAANNASGYGLLMGYDNVNGYARIRNVSNTALTFETNNTERIRITSGGNVGIGTQTPDTPLAGRRGLVLNGGSNDDVAYLIQTTTTGSASTDGIRLAISGTAGYLYNDENNFFSFGTNGTERMRITSGGNLLIGTTTDAGYKLNVSGSFYTNQEFSYYFQRTSGIPSDLYSWSANAAAAYLYNHSTSNVLVSFFEGGNVEIQNGSIKTAAPTTGTAGEWKLGIRVAATVALDTTQYIQLDIGGTLYKLAIVT